MTYCEIQIFCDSANMQLLTDHDLHVHLIHQGQENLLYAEHKVARYCRTVAYEKHAAVALVLKNAVAFFTTQQTQIPTNTTSHRHTYSITDWERSLDTAVHMQKCQLYPDTVAELTFSTHCKLLTMLQSLDSEHVLNTLICQRQTKQA